MNTAEIDAQGGHDRGKYVELIYDYLHWHQPHFQAPQLQNVNIARWGEPGICEHDVIGKGPGFSEQEGNVLYIAQPNICLVHDVQNIRSPLARYLQ